MTEDDRLGEYDRRGNTWPPAKMLPDTAAYKELIRRREAQVMAFDDNQDRWDAWNNLVKQAIMPSFTPLGYKLMDVPKDLHAKLHKSLHDGMNTDEETEEGGVTQVREIYVNGRPNAEDPSGRPTFVHNGGLMNEVLHGLKSIHEEWAGVKLTPSIAYGMRIYKNVSALLMHIDKIDTHVISSIVHVDHEYDDDNRPWPIEIEDHDGNVAAIDLKPGQMLLYESAKCMHGRPKVFYGKYYSSVFVHYRPAVWSMVETDVEYAIPEHWVDAIEQHPAMEELARYTPKMQMSGTGMINLGGFGFDSVILENEMLDPIMDEL